MLRDRCRFKGRCFCNDLLASFPLWELPGFPLLDYSFDIKTCPTNLLLRHDNKTKHFPWSCTPLQLLFHFSVFIAKLLKIVGSTYYLHFLIFCFLLNLIRHPPPIIFIKISNGFDGLVLISQDFLAGLDRVDRPPCWSISSSASETPDSFSFSPTSLQLLLRLLCWTLLLLCT